MPRIYVEKSFHPNEQLRWEGWFKDGILHGKNHHWHENGQLSSETSYEDGLENGVARQWNQAGKLLGEYRIDHGTGIAKSWYENGQLESEMLYVRGRCCGRFRCWFEDGELAGTDYYNMGKKVSRKKYLEACKTDSTLPRLEEDATEHSEPEIVGLYKKRNEPISEMERQKHREFINKFLRQPNRGEACQWLAGDENRFIGEMDPEGSREWIQEGYQAGAIKILAVEIQDNTTNCLIVELPPTGKKRERVFRWSNRRAQTEGFDADLDWGQNELFVFFD